MRVLVTSVGGALAPLNIRLLKAGRRHAVWVLGVDRRADAAGRHFADAFAAVPAGYAPDYVETIVSLVGEYAIDLVLPWSDEEALALATSRSSIEAAGAVLACAPIETLTIMSDKAASYDLLARHGVRTPAVSIVHSDTELAVAVAHHAAAGDGFAVKPPAARGNRGVIVVRPDVEGATPYLASREWHMDLQTFERDYRPKLAAEMPLLVSERLYPPAYDIDVLAQDGQLLRAMPRERLNPAGVPFTGGILRPTPALLSLAERVTAVLRLSWLYDYDIMCARDGEPVVLELNPRPSGSIAASILAGVPFYDDLMSLVSGEPLPDIELPADVAVVPFLDCAVVQVDALG